MAYTLELNQKCSTPSCKKRPMVEVKGSRNQSYGHHCRPCGARAIKRLNEEERQAFNNRGV